MANPNIASIGELYGGSLAWTLSPTQPVLAYGSYDSNGYKTSGWSNGTQTWAWRMPSAFSDRLLIMTFMAKDIWEQILAVHHLIKLQNYMAPKVLRLKKFQK